MAHSRVRRAGGRELTLALDAGAGTAGGAISGELSGPVGTATVSLVRVERSPSGRFEFAVSSCPVDLGGGRSRFEVDIPGALPPAAVGRRCRLDYVVRADCAPSRWTRRRAVAPVALTACERPVHEDSGDSTVSSPPIRHAGSTSTSSMRCSRAAATSAGVCTGTPKLLRADSR